MLELRRLRYLVVLANRLSYSRAASELGLSQSALTRAIQSLEREVGMRLFDRDQAGVRLTEQGRWMVEKAESLLVNASEFNRQVSEAAIGSEGRVRFGMSPMAAHCVLPQVLGERLDMFPTFSHEVLVRETEPLSLMLAKGELEFLVCEEWVSDWPLPESLPVTAQPIGTLDASLIVRRGHPVHSADQLDARYPLMVGRVPLVWSKLASQVAQRFAMTMQVVEEGCAASQLTQATDAVWLTSKRAVAAQLQDGALRDLGLPDGEQTADVTLSLYSLARRTKSPTARELQDAFRLSLTT